MTKIPTKAIYIRVSEKDHKTFKTFAASNNITLRTFLRSAAYHFMRESQKGDKPTVD